MQNDYSEFHDAVRPLVDDRNNFYDSNSADQFLRFKGIAKWKA